MRLPISLSFEWDKGNRDKNWIKHKITDKEAEEAFFHKPLKTFKDRKHSQKEERFVALGVTNQKKTLYIVFTIRNKKIRVISARKQSRKERNAYAKEKN